MSTSTRPALVCRYGEDPETGEEAVKLVVYREHRYCMDNYFVLMKCEGDVVLCKKLLDDLRLMKASLFELVCSPIEYKIQFTHLINRAMRVIECELLRMARIVCAVGATVRYG